METAEEEFSAKFKILVVEPAYRECAYDESGKLLEEKSLKVVQKGCIVRLEIVSVTSGNLPVENREKRNVYSIFENGPVCNKSVGAPLNTKIQSIRFK